MKLLVVDRDTGYLFKNEADPDAIDVNVTVDGVDEDRLEEEGYALWLQNEEGDALKVVPFEGYDFDKADDGWWPIATPIIVEDMAEYERLSAE